MSTLAGIDIGSEAIKGVVLNFAKNGKAEMLAAGSLPISDLAHMEDSPDKILALGVKLKELVKGARLHGATRRMAVSGKNTGIRYLQVPPVPPWRLDMLVKYEVEEKSGDKEPTAYDYHILGVPEVGGQYTVMIGTCREAASQEMLQIGKAAGLGEVEIDLEALALYNAYYHGHGYDADKTVLIADIGADDMTVVLCRNGVLWFARTILGGGRRFSQVLADELKVELAEAEELKKTQAEISFDLAPPSTTRVGIPKRFGAAGASMRGATGIIPRAGERSGVIKLDPSASTVVPAGDAPPASGPRALNPGNSTLITLPKPSAGAGQSEGSAGAPTEVLDREQIKNALSGAKLPLSAPSAPGANATPSAGPELPGSDDLFLLDMPPSLESLGAKSESAPSTLAPAPVAAAQPAIPPLATAASAPPGLSNDTLLSIPSIDELTAPTAPAAPSAAVVAPAADPQSDDKRKKQMSAALVREAAQLCAALENAVLFTKQQAKLRELKIDRVYLTGGGSKLKGLQEFMGRRMRMEVAPLEPLRQISLDRLPAEQSAALKNDQHTMAVALGLSLSNLPGATAYQLWPAVIEQKKIFWSRGAYLYYAAAMVALAIVLFLFTPYRNAQALAANNTVATGAVTNAEEENKKIATLKSDYDENVQRLKQIDENIQSGDKFLNILAELKSRDANGETGRISDDVYITCISTHMPKFLITLSGKAATTPKGPGAGLGNSAAAANNAGANGPDTFQAQRRIYIRGFVSGPNQTELVGKVRAFWKKIVPHEDQPDHPDNLFKDVIDIWYGRPEPSGSNFVLEFVLEVYTEGTRDVAPEASEKGPPRRGRQARKPGKTVTD